MKMKYEGTNFKAFGSLFLVSILLFSSMSLISGVNVSLSSFSGDVGGGFYGFSLTPHPIWGYAEYYNGGWAVDADVTVHTDDEDVDPEDRTVYDTVGSGGEWSVDVGCPGPCWPDGTEFIVWVNGTGDYDGWQNISYGTVSGYSNNMGTLILGPPELVADASYEDGCYVPGDSVQFYGNASGGVSPYSWSWDFDDGGTSSEQNPVHQFDDSGSYDVCLTVTDDLGNSDTDCITVVINEEINADADGPYNGTIFEAIDFNGDVSGGCPPYTWLWDFGDGNTSTEEDPSHQYTKTGTYDVTLTVTDDVGSSDMDTTWVLIKEENLPPEKPSINGPTSGVPGTEYDYEFTAEDPNGDKIKYIINWGDGASNTTDLVASGTQVTVGHSWDEMGTFTITAKAQDEYGETGEEETLEITIPRNKSFNFNVIGWLFGRFHMHF